MTECCGVGALSRLAIGLSAGTPTRMDFLLFTPQIVKTLSDGSKKAIRGTLDHQPTSVAEGILHVRFRTSMYLTAAKMDILLPCLGFTESPTNTYTLGDVLPASKIIVGPASAPEDTYDGCVPTDFVVYGQEGADPIIIDIGWIGKTWATATNGTFFTSQSSPAMTEGYTYPFAAQGSGNAATLTLGSPFSLDLGMPQIRMTMDYHIVPEFLNSITATNLCPTDHDLNIATSSLYSTCDGTTSIFTTPMAGTVTGASLAWNLQRLVSTNNQTRFTVANVKMLARPPRITKNDYNRLPINMNGYASGATPMLVVLNVNAGA